MGFEFMTKETKIGIVIGILALCALGFLLLQGCAMTGIPKPPSVCDELPPGESLLCDLAIKHDLNLETVGNLILVADLRAIKQKAYTKRQALHVFNTLEAAVGKDGVLGKDLALLAIKYAYDYPELLLVMPYLNYLKVEAPITEKDRELLTIWIDQNRTVLKR